MKGKKHNTTALAGLVASLVIIALVLAIPLLLLGKAAWVGVMHKSEYPPQSDNVTNGTVIHAIQRQIVDVIENEMASEVVLLTPSDNVQECGTMRETTSQEYSEDSAKNTVIYETSHSIPMTIERVDYSIRNTEGEAVGITYYDKPVLSGEFDITNKINAFFKDECWEFFFGEYKIKSDFKRDYDRFNEHVVHALETNFLEASEPFLNTVETEVKYNDGKILSVLQRAFWHVGGCAPKYCYGDSFDVDTGELINPDYFIEVDINQFRDKIEMFIIEKFVEWDGDILEQKADSLKEALDNMEFKDYEYYYDGEAIFILFNEIAVHDGCYIIRWDLCSGELSGN